MMHIVKITFLTAVLLQNPSLDSTSPSERQAAIEQLATPGNASAIPTLAGALKKEPRADVRAVIVVGLTRINDPSVAPILAETLRSDLDEDVRLQVVESMQRLYIPMEDEGRIRTVFNRVKSAFAEADRPLVPAGVRVAPEVKEALAAAMQRDFNEEVRAAAARALGSLRATDQVSTMITTLEDPQQREHEEVRVEIVGSLGLIRDMAAGPALQRALRDGSREVVEKAVVAVGLIGYREARPELENIFRTDRNRDIRRRALESLSLIRDPASMPLFESLLVDRESHSREIAAEGLARIGYDSAKFKQRYDQEREPNVRVALAFGMASGGEDAYINDLANALDGRQAFQAEVYLYELGKYEGRMSELHRYLRSPNPRVRARMARVVGDIGDPASRPEIQALSNDQDVEVVREALAALRRLP